MITINDFNNTTMFNGEKVIVFDFIYCADTGMSMGVFTRIKDNKTSKLLMGDFEYEQEIK